MKSGLRPSLRTRRGSRGRRMCPSVTYTALELPLLLWHLVKLDAAEREKLSGFDLTLLDAS